MSISIEKPNSPYYVVIDLGSNSFHMLITRQLANSVQVIDKIKRKVRLGAGLNNQNVLSEQAIIRGLTCLGYFAERLINIPQSQTRIVATAAVRQAKNSADFLQRAQQTLGRDICLLTGEQEAQLIYLGAAYTCNDCEQRLVVDIGGASTELIVGLHLDTKKVISLDIGCVTLNRQFFTDGLISQNTFNKAKCHAASLLLPIVEDFAELDWHKVLGGSGTIQALAEILIFQQKPAIIKRSLLKNIAEQLLTFEHIDDIKIPGLKSERVPVFCSGVAILTAIFDCLGITELQLSHGALREGLLYQMLPDLHRLTASQQNIKSLMQRYHVDIQYTNNVRQQAKYLFNCFSKSWHLKQDTTYYLLLASCDLHEIGLLLAYKNYQQHSAYIIEHSNLVGFNQTEQQCLRALVLLHRGKVTLTNAEHGGINQDVFIKLLIILRLAIILCRQRNDHHLPAYHAYIDQEIYLNMPNGWLHNHRLVADELKQETTHLKAIGYELRVN